MFAGTHGWSYWPRLSSCRATFRQFQTLGDSWDTYPFIFRINIAVKYLIELNWFVRTKNNMSGIWSHDHWFGTLVIYQLSYWGTWFLISSCLAQILLWSFFILSNYRDWFSNLCLFLSVQSLLFMYKNIRRSIRSSTFAYQSLLFRSFFIFTNYSDLFSKSCFF